MPEETEDYIRSGHKSARGFDAKSFRTISVGKGGIKAIVGCPKGKYVGGRCKVGMRVKSYLFPKSKGWTKEKAAAWMKSHKSKKEEIAKTPLTKEEIENFRSQLVVLKARRQALYKQDSALWEKRNKILEKERKRLRAIFQPEHDKIGKELDKISSEIRALEIALGIEISQKGKM